MNRTWRKSATVALTGALTLLPSVLPNASPAATAATGPEGTLRAVLGTGVPGLNPHIDSGTGAGTFPTHNLIYEQLITQHADGSFQPLLAESWEASPDNLTLTFHLHDGVVFSDGTPFDADAVKANIEFVQNGSPEQVGPAIAEGLSMVESIDVLSPTEVRLNLSEPVVTLLLFALSKGGGFMVQPDSLGQANESPIGTGPYVFNAEDSASDLAFIALDANESYWQPELVGLERVELTVMTDEAARQAAFEAGQFEVIPGNARYGEPTPPARIVYQEGIYNILELWVIVDWKGETIPQLADREVRCAMAQAVNRAGTAQRLGLDPSQARTQWAGGPDDYLFIEDLDEPEFDIEAAKARFEASGAEPFSFDTAVTPAREEIAEPYVGALQELGISMQINIVDPPVGASLVRDIGAGTWPVMQISALTFDPLVMARNFGLPDGAHNGADDAPEGVAELIEEASQLPLDEAEAPLAEAWRIMLEECIWIPMFRSQGGYWVAGNVSGFELGSSPAWNLRGVRVDG